MKIFFTRNMFSIKLDTQIVRVRFLRSKVNPKFSISFRLHVIRHIATISRHYNFKISSPCLTSINWKQKSPKILTTKLITFTECIQVLCNTHCWNTLVCLQFLYWYRLLKLEMHHRPWPKMDFLGELRYSFWHQRNDLLHHTNFKLLSYHFSTEHWHSRKTVPNGTDFKYLLVHQPFNWIKWNSVCPS